MNSGTIQASENFTVTNTNMKPTAEERIHEVNKALLFIKENHNGEIPYQFSSNEYGLWMARYANNAVEEYKEGLIKKIEPLFNYVDGKELKMEWKDKMVPVVEFNELLEILNKD